MRPQQGVVSYETCPISDQLHYVLQRDDMLPEYRMLHCTYTGTVIAMKACFHSPVFGSIHHSSLAALVNLMDRLKDKKNRLAESQSILKNTYIYKITG